MRAFNKIFGIGLSRTGTSSLATALRSLGIPTVHWPASMDAIETFRGATDITVSCRFEELDSRFPGSLFIYTERQSAPWLASVTDHHARKDPSLVLSEAERSFTHQANLKLYGAAWPSTCNFVSAYARHHQSVVTYFEGKTEQFLRLNISTDGNWDGLCRFLDVLPPAMRFPHRNSRSIKYRRDVLDMRVSSWPRGRAAALIAAGIAEGDLVVIDRLTHAKISARFPQPLPNLFALHDLQQLDLMRPEGFVAFVLEKGMRNGENIVLSAAAHKRLHRTFYLP